MKMHTTNMNKKFMRTTQTALVVTLAITLGACQTTKQQTGTAAGAGFGAVLGSLIGKSIGGKSGQWIGAGLGALAGGMIGNEIGRVLDEQDRLLASQSTMNALTQSREQGGKPAIVSWQSEKNEGVSGSATAVASSPSCYVVQEVAVVPNVGDVRQETQYCDQNGEWVPLV